MAEGKLKQIVRWRTSVSDHEHGPFGGQEENEARPSRPKPWRVNAIASFFPKRNLKPVRRRGRVHTFSEISKPERRQWRLCHRNRLLP